MHDFLKNAFLDEPLATNYPNCLQNASYILSSNLDFWCVRRQESIGQDQPLEGEDGARHRGLHEFDEL
jgi:hypothetical protein